MFAVKAHHKIDLDVGHLWSRHIFCFIVYLCAFISTIILMLYDGAFVRREYDSYLSIRTRHAYIRSSIQNDWLMKANKCPLDPTIPVGCPQLRVQHYDWKEIAMIGLVLLLEILQKTDKRSVFRLCTTSDRVVAVEVYITRTPLIYPGQREGGNSFLTRLHSRKFELLGLTLLTLHFALVQASYLPLAATLSVHPSFLTK